MRSSDFRVIREQGCRQVGRHLVANWSLREDARFSRVGVIASKRIGGAVVRNRAKRLLRESFRQLQCRMTTTMDLILIARQSMVSRDLKQVMDTLEGILSRAGLLETPRT